MKNEDSNNITGLEGTLNDLGALKATISGFRELWGVAGDQSTQAMYLTNSPSGEEFVIGGSTGLSVLKRESTAYVAETFGFSYDAANGKMDVKGYSNNIAYVPP